MFTIKYRTFTPSDTQQSGGPVTYDTNEQIHGPYAFVSQEMQDGLQLVHAHREDGSPGITFGPVPTPDIEKAPRPTLWVMNEAGATVATYHL